jgi:hypothetical protein
MTKIEHPQAYNAAIKRNIISNARKTWMKKTTRANEILDATESGRVYGDYGNVMYADGFMGSMARAIDTFGKLTEKQSEAILKGIDSFAAKKAEWAIQKAALNSKRAHLGTVGQKVTLTLTTVHIIVLHGMYGSNFIHICEDADQNVVIYKGKSYDFPCNGATATMTATVKEHGLRDGVKQTVIQRPKVIKQA